MVKEVDILEKNTFLDKLYLSIGIDCRGEAIQIGGKPLLGIEAVLNTIGLKVKLLLFKISHLKVVLHFLLQRNPVLPCACCDDPFCIKGVTG